jgi:hypothetical protein
VAANINNQGETIMDKIIELGRVSAETHGPFGADTEGAIPPCLVGCD